MKLTVVPCPPVVEVKIRRPDTKYQLGFSVQNGVVSMRVKFRVVQCVFSGINENVDSLVPLEQCSLLYFVSCWVLSATQLVGVKGKVF